MKRIHAKQLMLAFSLTATICLAAAVFLWGSEYKCSLYHGHPEKHARVAVAKLLSDGERPAALQGARLRAPLSRAVFFALGFPLFGVVRRSRSDWADLSLWRDAAAAGRSRCVIHFSFRPPPARVA